MRTLGVLLFIAGVAALAIFLARKPTIASGAVMEAEFLALFRPQGVTAMACDREIRIGRQGAAFACTATLQDGATQRLDCAMDRDGRLIANPAASPRSATALLPAEPPAAAGAPPDGIRTSGDPWGN